MKTVQPSQFNNRIFLKERLTTGLKIKSSEAKNNYIIEGIDLKESTEDYYCYIIQEVWNIRELFKDVEYEITGYKPEYKIALKETKKVDPSEVDIYLENLKEDRKLERQYRDYLKSSDFNLTGFWGRDREEFRKM